MSHHTKPQTTWSRKGSADLHATHTLVLDVKQSNSDTTNALYSTTERPH